MARKKFYNNKPDANVVCNPKIWKAGLYIRLSREDGDKAESDSIANQKKLLTYYVEDHEELSYFELFVDENYSGTNFERPAFMRMIKSLKSGEINCIIIKDLSRFAREYIGAGHYLENVLPKYECRFISIIDGIDTHIDPESIIELMVRFKLIFHDYNVSVKTSTPTKAKINMR